MHLPGRPGGRLRSGVRVLRRDRCVLQLRRRNEIKSWWSHREERVRVEHCIVGGVGWIRDLLYLIPEVETCKKKRKYWSYLQVLYKTYVLNEDVPGAAYGD